MKMDEITLKEIKLNQIVPDPLQPRNLPSLDTLTELEAKGDSRAKEIMDGLRDLATSILDVGLKQPISVYQSEEKNRYVLFDGHRRWMAFNILFRQGAGFETIPCHVYDTPPVTDTDNLLGQLNVNIQRRDLNVFELARSLAKIHKNLKDNGGKAKIIESDEVVQYIEVNAGEKDEVIWNIIEKRLGIGHPRRYQILAVLKLPEKIQEIAEKANLPESRIRYLIPITDQMVLEKITLEMIENDLSNAEIKQRIKELEGTVKEQSFPKPIQIKSTLQPISKIASLINETDNISRIISMKDPRTVEGYRKLLPELKTLIQDMTVMLEKLQFLEDTNK
jgi:ParB/RepB/Spo0J family partition protein